MRNALVATFILLAVSLPAQAQNASTLRLLEQRIPEATFVDTPLEQVIDWIADFTRLNVVVRWQILEDSGLPRDKPITLKAKNLRLSQVLWMIMNESGGADLKLAYRASGKLLVLSTDQDLNREMITKVYDVSDLLVRIPRFSGRATLDPSQALQQAGQGGGVGLQGGAGGGGGGGGGGGQIFQGGQQDDEGDNETEGTDVQRLVDLITQTIEPDSWNTSATGGGGGSISVFRNVLIIRNTVLAHQKIGGYISEGDVGAR